MAEQRAQFEKEGIEILGAMTPEFWTVLTPQAITYLAKLHRSFDGRRQELLRRRVIRQQELDGGKIFDFLPETEHIRNNPDWKCVPPAPGLVDRRVEITGPVDRKMVINALNSGASTFMADLEGLILLNIFRFLFRSDYIYKLLNLILIFYFFFFCFFFQKKIDSNSPTWDNNLSGQINLRDANLRTIEFAGPNGRTYKLNKNIATLIVRPRGWHLDEKHFLVDGAPISASLFDFGLYFFHNAQQTIANGMGPYFYLPKMESHLEARLWSDVFKFSEDELKVEKGKLRATCLIETLPASFEMQEFLYELKDYSSGLNCGRWDYMFSAIKRLRNHPQYVLPDRAAVTMTVSFMEAYVRLLIDNCHRRGVHAMGGMAANIPVKDDAKANEVAMTKVRNDKEREVKAGHDGTWVAHPGLVQIAKEIFDKYMPSQNQLNVMPAKIPSSLDLIPKKVDGQITEQGIRSNIAITLMYMESWLRGVGCVPIHNVILFFFRIIYLFYFILFYFI